MKYNKAQKTCMAMYIVHVKENLNKSKLRNPLKLFKNIYLHQTSLTVPECNASIIPTNKIDKKSDQILIFQQSYVKKKKHREKSKQNKKLKKL